MFLLTILAPLPYIAAVSVSEPIHIPRYFKGARQEGCTEYPVPDCSNPINIGE